MLLVAIIVDPTARVYSFEAPADRKEAVWHSHSSNKFNAAPAASFNPKTQENQDLPTAFLQNRILAHVKSQRRINRFRILHGRLGVFPGRRRADVSDNF
jgi:hypothetical protein